MKIKLKLFLFLLLASTAFASGQKILRVGTPGDYKPFSIQNPNTKTYEGLDIDLIQDFAKSHGYKIIFVKSSWPTLMSDYEAGKFDVAVGGISKTPEREQKAAFAMSYLTSGKTPIARCTEKNKLDTLKKIDKSKVTLIVNPGGTNQKFVSANIHKAKVVVYPDNTTIFNQIIDGKADVMITDSVEATLQAKLHPELCMTTPGKTFDQSEKAFMLAHDPKLKKEMDEWMASLQSQGKLKEILDGYLH